MNQFLLSSKQKVPFVCFNCRVGFKKPIPFYYEEYGDERRPDWANPKCPHCKKPMAYLGRYFKLPAQNARVQWRKVELLWRSGWIADGYPSRFAGNAKTLRDAREMVQKPRAEALRQAVCRRSETEERWRKLQLMREHRRRHKAV